MKTIFLIWALTLSLIASAATWIFIPASGEFAPESLPFDYLFYDQYTESSGAIVTWTDKKGSHNATATNSPTINATDATINNRFSINFVVASSQYLTFGGSTEFFDPSKPWTYVALVNHGNPTEAAFRLINPVKGTTGSGAHFGYHGTNESYRYFYVGRNTVNEAQRDTSGVASGWEYIVAIYDGDGTWTMYRNNNLVSLTNGPGTVSHDNAASRIGSQANNTPAAFWNGKMAFIAGGQFTLSEGQRNALWSWIQDYYGL